ncbi:hypothetical protein CC78DRAFT_536126, partial [Lojkania enalia]
MLLHILVAHFTTLLSTASPVDTKPLVRQNPENRYDHGLLYYDYNGKIFERLEIWTLESCNNFSWKITGAEVFENYTCEYYRYDLIDSALSLKVVS